MRWVDRFHPLSENSLSLDLAIVSAAACGQLISVILPQEVGIYETRIFFILPSLRCALIMGFTSAYL